MAKSLAGGFWNLGLDASFRSASFNFRFGIRETGSTIDTHNN
jgi:hypothetical protein